MESKPSLVDRLNMLADMWEGISLVGLVDCKQPALERALDKGISKLMTRMIEQLRETIKEGD